MHDPRLVLTVTLLQQMTEGDALGHSLPQPSPLLSADLPKPVVECEPQKTHMASCGHKGSLHIPLVPKDTGTGFPVLPSVG